MEIISKSLLIEKVASVLGLSVKKVYKWGYDRKHVSRSMTQLQGGSRKDYNNMVDEILMLKTEEVHLTKRKYKTRKQNDNVVSDEIKDKSEPSSLKNNASEGKFENSEELSELNHNAVDDLMKVSDIDIPDLNQELFVFKLDETQNFDSFSKIRNEEEYFLNRNQTDLPTFTPKSQRIERLDNIWSTNTSEFDFPLYY